MTVGEAYRKTKDILTEAGFEAACTRSVICR